MKRLYISIIVLFITSLTFSSRLSDLVGSMQPGEWAELTSMQGFTAGMFEDGGSCGILADSEDAIWNPVTQQLYILGAGAGFSSGAIRGKFITYKANTNTWVTLPKPSAFRGTHSYDHHAIDIVNQAMYHRPYHSRSVYKYTFSNGSWSTLPEITSALMGYNNCCVGLEYFPEIKSLVYASVESGEMGSLIRFDIQANQWKRVGSGRDMMMGSHNHFAEYNPIHKVVIFGGPSADRLYKVDADLTVSPIANGPFSMGNRSAIVTVDPASGEYLVLRDANSFYAYDVPSDTWHKLPGNIPHLFTFGYYDPINIFACVATPLWDLGAVIFVKQKGGTAKVVVYKHKPVSATTQAMIPAGTRDMIQISPNPFHNTTRIKLNTRDAQDLSSLRILDIRGKVVRDFTRAISSGRLDRSLFWNGTDNSGNPVCSGVYYMVLKSGKSTSRFKIVLM